MKSVGDDDQVKLAFDEPVVPSKRAAVEVSDSDAELTADERGEIETAMEESAAEFARGEIEEARGFVLRIASRS